MGTDALLWLTSGVILVIPLLENDGPNTVVIYAKLDGTHLMMSSCCCSSEYAVAADEKTTGNNLPDKTKLSAMSWSLVKCSSSFKQSFIIIFFIQCRNRSVQNTSELFISWLVLVV